MKQPDARSPAIASAPSTADQSGVVILGTSRSGTSAIARAFVRAGFFAGTDEQLLGPMPSNLKGHFESLSVLELNEEVLRRFDSPWWAQGPPADAQLQHKDEYLPRIDSILKSLRSQAEGQPIMIKDPRISALLPIWRAAIDPNLHAVLAIRSPVEVALSLFERDGTPLKSGLAAWELHMSNLLGYLDGTDVTVAPFAQIVSRPENVVKAVESAVTHIDSAYAEHVNSERAGAGIDPRLPTRHDDRLCEELLSSGQKRLWDFLQSLSAGGCRIEAPAEFREPPVMAQDLVRQEGERLRAQAGLRYIATTLDGMVGRVGRIERQVEETASVANDLTQAVSDTITRAETAEADIAAIEASRSWRMTGPLRRFGELWRGR